MKKIFLLFGIFLIFLSAFSTQAQTQMSNIDTTQISFKSGKYTLFGQLLTPKGKKNLPAIVFLVGSSGNSSYKGNYKKFLTEIIEKPFAQDFALLYFDKRGVNKSEGKWQKADFFDRAEDAINAIRFLKTLPEIDSTKIGVVGHSQGGWICEIMADIYQKEFSFAVSLAGPAVSVFEQLTEDYESQLACKGLDSLQAHKKAIHKTKVAFRAAWWFGCFNKNLRQLQKIRNFNPKNNIKNIKIPFLFMFGENDALVYPKNSIKRLNEIFANQLPKHITTTIIPRSNHSFLEAEKCYKGKSSLLNYSEKFKMELKNFLLTSQR